MARVEIELPERFGFATELEVRITDLNYGNHLGNDRVLTLAHEARARWLASLGFRELDICGVGIVIADAAVIYRQEVHYPRRLRVEVAARDLRSRGFEVVYRFSDAATGEEIALAKTGIVCFDYAARRVVHLPGPFRRAVGG
jgi:acyl-CoA thioester hydrolase